MSMDGRYEIKFVLNENDLIEAKHWLNNHTPTTQSYPPRQVHSIYFDDNEFQSVKDNLSGVSDRFKIRLRWYQSGASDISVPALEVKSRKGRLGFKQKIILPELQTKIMEIPISDIASEMKDQVLNIPLGCRIFDQHLNPTLYVNYSRSYYNSPNDIRVTEDEKIQFSYIVPSIKLSELPTMPYSPRILELKFLPQMKDEVSHWLKNLHLVPKRHSKYLTGLAIFGQVRYL